MAVSPRIGAFLDELQALLDAKDWPELDREAVTATPGDQAALVVLPHRHGGPGVEIEVHDDHVWVAYGPERIDFTRADEALRFVEMLGDGRVELVIRRSPGWRSLRSYRDGLALPFRKHGEPWANLRWRTERVRFGFGAMMQP